MLRKLMGRLTSKVYPPRWLTPSVGKEGAAKIAVHGVRHRYQNIDALENVTLDIHPGEFVCLLGPSGCGKTTLLYALAGQFAPSHGQIAIDGVPVSGPSPDRLLMFQEPALFPWLTVKQNLMLALRGRYPSRAEREARAHHFIDKVHLTGFEGTLPHQLSGGMKMRASLARSLAMNPAVLLMDEPFGALDAQTRGHMHQLLQQVWLETRKTVVFVTHDVREALVLGNRVVVMAARPGRILQDLEVKLSRPRDPDDETLVRYSRQIREELIRAEKAGEPSRKSATEAGHDKTRGRASAAGVHAGVTPSLGTGG